MLFNTISYHCDGVGQGGVDPCGRPSPNQMFVTVNMMYSILCK